MRRFLPGWMTCHYGLRRLRKLIGGEGSDVVKQRLASSDDVALLANSQFAETAGAPSLPMLTISRPLKRRRERKA
jgi:hypothetical protein